MVDYVNKRLRLISEITVQKNNVVSGIRERTVSTEAVRIIIRHTDGLLADPPHQNGSDHSLAQIKSVN